MQFPELKRFVEFERLYSERRTARQTALKDKQPSLNELVSELENKISSSQAFSWFSRSF